MNSNLKEKAIKLRRSGYSYSEILKEVPIAKSTLSLWLRSVNLAKKQKQKITQKRIAGALKGAQARRNQKIATTKKIKDKAKKEIKNINKKDLWLIGIALYWAEGAKEHQTGTGISFSNSDDRMILLFLKWLKDIFKIKNSELIYELYIHETANIKQSQIYWSRKLSITINQLRVYLKKNKIKTIRNNIGDDYHGLVRIKVKKSSNLNRKITGWIEGIYKKL
ncbi:MAG: hypothetical protein PHI45_03265 [Candidatus Pacebacteria bacterium]|nr:hypothetical protein [Candidatus Paceibacterota bacterium]MDD5013181.1 hypothetical protein [Candidatus Paceibacterota bacterium]MDD5753073.1 hypothetical protein [Candidatus Paceibacterota bacterium]